MMSLLSSPRFHKLVRWGLGIHGTIHIIEFLINIYEGAFLSAIFTFLAGLLMISGAMIDANHHSKDA
tara:strand:+ start:189 stop:389 length:201 start_codon:yes stop_codon:yes gene_type:complete